jgi:uncharacterized membrane protein
MQNLKEKIESEKDSFIKNINELHDSQRTLGEKVADKMADFAGSWTFILSFMAIILLWISLNSWIVLFKPYDPYPFILLNLVLSCLAALQAPIIMMSQKRQEGKDRLRSQHDYDVDVKTEMLVEHMISQLDEIKKQQAEIWKSLEQNKKEE